MLATALVAMVVAMTAARGQQPLVQSMPPTTQPAETAPPERTTPELDLASRAASARNLAHLYAERMRQNISSALKEGGPVRAIDACNTLAPELNASVPDGTTFEVARTALRVRNPDNAPDTWEQGNLETFEKSMASGADPKTLEIYEVVATKEGQRLFRYMRPITMREACMSCHGSSVAAEVKSEIAKYYPDDRATGYSIGDLRGAFSIVQQID